ncbi:hypothetical protein PA13_1011555 [Pseudomonas aeruginosa HB13]|nr:hypothetical protein PA13_1011555 [Pseudomonas aeruginosa HB13]
MAQKARTAIPGLQIITFYLAPQMRHLVQKQFESLCLAH